MPSKSKVAWGSAKLTIEDDPVMAAIAGEVVTKVKKYFQKTLYSLRYLTTSKMFSKNLFLKNIFEKLRFERLAHEKKVDFVDLVKRCPTHFRFLVCGIMYNIVFLICPLFPFPFSNADRFLCPTHIWSQKSVSMQRRTGRSKFGTEKWGCNT